jgi:hypothetical protein
MASKAMFEGKEDLIAASPLWRDFDPKNLARTRPVVPKPPAPC